MNDICKNCGGWKGIHHWQTMQCPFGGREAPLGKKELYLSSTFEPEIDDVAALRAERDDLLSFVRDVANPKNWIVSNGEEVWNTFSGNEHMTEDVADMARAVLAKYQAAE